MDYLSKCPDVNAFPNQELSTVADVLMMNFFCHLGVQRELYSDQGQNVEFGIQQEM
jgi:hypothetical protein